MKMKLYKAYLDVINEQTLEKTPLKASELITILQKRIDEYGDLEISVDTQDGASYSLYSEDDVKIVEGENQDTGAKTKFLEIGWFIF